MNLELSIDELAILKSWGQRSLHSQRLYYFSIPADDPEKVHAAHRLDRIQSFHDKIVKLYEEEIIKTEIPRNPNIAAVSKPDRNS